MESKGNIIVLAGTKWQIPLVKRIKAEGYAAIVFNLYEDSPAFEYADDYRTADILDIETCLKLSRPFAPVAVVSDECDIATPSVALLAEKLGLPSIGMDKAKLYTNKYRMRTFGRRHQFHTPVFCKCKTVTQALDFFQIYNKKMIMKPLDGNSSRGIYTIHCKEDIIKNFESSLQHSKAEQSVMLEEYIEGTEFTVDGIVTEQGHVSLAVSEKRHYAYNENIACSLYFSYSNPKYDYNKLRKLNDEFVNLSGLPFGLTHAEYKYSHGQFYLIEIGARGGGNLISAVIVPFLSGIDNYGYLLSGALGHEYKGKIRLKEKERCAVLHFFDVEKEQGIVKKIWGEEVLSCNPRILDYCLYCKEGERVCRAADDSKRIGYYIAYGDNRNELDDLVRKINDSFRIEVEEI